VRVDGCLDRQAGPGEEPGSGKEWTSGGGSASWGARRLTRIWRAHVAALLRAAGIGLETEALADSLLGPLASELYRYQREVRGLSQAEVARGLALLATRVLAPG
jgi:hypothetical protein